MSTLESHPIVRRLMIEAPGISDPGAFLQGLAQQLRAVGIEITRIARV